MVFRDLWFWMDVCLIAIGLLALWVVPAIVGGEDTSGFEPKLQDVGQRRRAGELG